ncbi:MAG: hypothetical protein M0031_00730 [Thermaerobacter sp.]|nr:hypothetical protein [Thermaerobacter sp.]
MVVVDRLFPSSKEWRKCGARHETFTLADRVFVCPGCSHAEGRELQDARNVTREDLRIAKTTVGSTGSDECGQAASTERKCFTRWLEEAGRQEAVAEDGQLRHQELHLG